MPGSTSNSGGWWDVEVEARELIDPTNTGSNKPARDDDVEHLPPSSDSAGVSNMRSARRLSERSEALEGNRAESAPVSVQLRWEHMALVGLEDALDEFVLA